MSFEWKLSSLLSGYKFPDYLKCCPSVNVLQTPGFKCFECEKMGIIGNSDNIQYSRISSVNTAETAAMSCCLNLLMKSEAFASTPSSPSPNDVDLSTLVVSGLLRSTDSKLSASSLFPAKPKPDFSLADFVIFPVAFFFFLTGFLDSDLLLTGLWSSWVIESGSGL
ncbi:hypothetical protein HID58_005012 [Brassica napus]|uniref:Uncharacterized protein n=1 Tax=Brassica napus TaxID=3708 RepID=A0ABQ8EA91_BRANA|nr:hypothetical protein HID58_005012 [Brassica napus]